MTPGNVTAYLARAARITMVLAVLLFALIIVQQSAYEAATGLVPRPAGRAHAGRDRPVLTEDQAQQQMLLNARRVFQPDGTVHLLVVPETYLAPAEDEVKVYDADHRRLWSGKRRDLPYHYVSWSTPARPGLHARQLRFLEMSGGEFSRSLTIPARGPEGAVLEQWDYQSRRERFVGYDLANRRIGYAGAGGFTDPAHPPAPLGEFEHMSAWRPRRGPGPALLWKTADALYEINFSTRSMQKLFESTDGLPFSVGVSNWWSRRDEPAEGRPLICSIDPEGLIDVLLREPDRRTRFHVPKDWRFGRVSLASADGKLLLRYRGSDRTPRPVELEWGPWPWAGGHGSEPGRHWVEMYEIDGAGQRSLVGRHEWTRPPARPSPATRATPVAPPADRARHVLSAFSTPIYSLAWRWRYRQLPPGLHNIEDLPPTEMVIGEIVAESRATRPALNLALSLLMVCVVLWHGWARRTSWVRFTFWMVFVAVFNLAGLLTYLALNHTPTIRCPACGRKRGLQGPSCRACSAPLPTPKRTDVDLISTP